MALENCKNGEDDPVIIYITKMILLKEKNVNEYGMEKYSSDFSPEFYGFARIFAGKLTRG